MKNDQKWNWIEKYENALRKLKERLTRELVLAVLNLDKKQMLVAYLSKSLDKMERNYEIYDKEMLAVIKELENWRYFLEDTKFKFKV